MTQVKLDKDWKFTKNDRHNVEIKGAGFSDMETNDKNKIAFQDKKSLLEKMSELSGMEAMNRILGVDDPSKMIRGLSRVDFFWLVKKIGAEDSHALLELASNEQWQYLLDMEIWKRDRLDPVKIISWIERFYNADRKRLANFFYEDEILLAHHYFYFNLYVITRHEDDQDIPDDFITFDDLYYIRILDKEHEEIIEKTLRELANEDYNGFQALLLGLAGVIPAEVEEEMYRLRGVRLAENGYLPLEEAMSVYSRIDLEKIAADNSAYKLYVPADEETGAIVPMMPFFYARGATLVARTTENFSDELFLDRLRLEFGGLCNQVMSADGTIPENIDTLKNICRKTAGYINIGLERLSGGDINVSRSYIENNPLISLFRAGFTSVLELKWEFDRFLRKAWYKERGLSEGFWGEEWEGLIKGLTLNRPLLFKGGNDEHEFRDFEYLREIEECRRNFLQIYALDKHLSILYSDLPLDEDRMRDPINTFHSMLFNYWACIILGLEPGFFSLSLEQVKDLFRLLRAGKRHPPYGMAKYETVFINTIVGSIDSSEDETLILKEAISHIWRKFEAEYEFVKIADLNIRYIKYLYVK
ncbi:MAG: hypothetical protein JW882_20075 [Deltaproteobacteria bacterium]|nr:hypothetical protein [Deltaproteobacteria bacterium]